MAAVARPIASVPPRATCAELAVHVGAKLGLIIIKGQAPKRLTQHLAGKYAMENLRA